MKRNDFSEIARRYERDSLVQRSAADLLVDLLEIRLDDDVLDLGCGTGHLTFRLAELTSGRVVGVDPSEGMIAQARANYGRGPRFEVAAAEDLEACARFDAVFCNSAIQWFGDPGRALAACARALRDGGRMAVQAPATREYCPNFLKGMAAVAREPATAATYARFHSPWFFLESAEAYADLFCRTGFAVPFSRIDTSRSKHSLEQALAVFESGAAAGYLNPDCYEVPLPDGYGESVRRILAREFRAQAGADGLVELCFRRIYLLAVKET
jgi:ubiquinone/menaquinone biosynthesis C-methylase UbiE